MDFLIKLVSIVVLAYFVRHSIKVIYVTGLFVHRHNHQPGPCRIVPGIEYGSEDIQTLPNGIALITTGMGAKETNSPRESRGIYMFDFNQPNKNVTKLKMTGKLHEKDFIPHGFSLWTDRKTGVVTIFVINHGPTYHYNESVEVFRYDETTKSMHHTRSIRDENFVRLNDIVATSDETFYVNNDCLWFQRDDWKWTIEPFLQTGFGNVVYYDGKSARPVASGYVLPNGINISPNHRYLYMTLFGEAQMVVFQRNTDNNLTEVKRVDLHMPGAENIDLDSDGNLWIAGRYKLLPDADKQLPSSMVLKGKQSNDEFTFSEVFVNDGSLLEKATVASFYNNQLLIGTPFSRLLYCSVRSL